jgi:hypothetical protein
MFDTGSGLICRRYFGSADHRMAAKQSRLRTAAQRDRQSRRKQPLGAVDEDGVTDSSDNVCDRWKVKPSGLVDWRPTGRSFGNDQLVREHHVPSGIECDLVI